jgi:hypothetical protein
MGKRIHPLPQTGARYGRWTVISPIESGDRITCRCECGAESLVRFSNLYRGISTSCGCRTREVTASRNRTHGLSGTRLYRIWKGMWTRCNTPSQTGYATYGALGIRVAHEWRDYTAFHQWAMDNGYTDAREIDRIDVRGDYAPNNCRFVSHVDNSRNKRQHRLITAFGETKTLAAWAEDLRCVVRHRCLVHRLNRGWSAERALSTPSDAVAA